MEQSFPRKSEDSVSHLIAQTQEPLSALRDWRASVLNILLPIIAVMVLPALIQTIYQLFIYPDIAWQGAAVYIVFYVVLVFVTVYRKLGSPTRGWALVVLTYLTGVAAMARGGLAGDGRIYLLILPILAVTLINVPVGIWATMVSLVTYMVFGVLAHLGILSQWLIRLDNPLNIEYWFYNGLTISTLIVAAVFVIVRFANFQMGTLEAVRKIAKALADAYQQLEIANQQLEQKVEQRTSELSKANQRLEELATHDSLTGLPNRVLLYERLEKAVKKSRKGRLRFALLFIDLNDFKKVNDTFGHLVGDHVLQIVADSLCKSVHENDTVARLAGDEFAIILNDIHSVSEIETVAHRISATIAQPIRFRQGTTTVSASIGASIYPDHGEDANSLLQKADTAMYRSKSRKSRYLLAK